MYISTWWFHGLLLVCFSHSENDFVFGLGCQAILIKFSSLYFQLFFSGKCHACVIASWLGTSLSLRLVIGYSDRNLSNLFEGICSIMMVSFSLSMAEKINLWHQNGFWGFFYSILFCWNGSKMRKEVQDTEETKLGMLNNIELISFYICPKL